MSWPSPFHTCAFLCYCDFHLLTLETMLLFTFLDAPKWITWTAYHKKRCPSEISSETLTRTFQVWTQVECTKKQSIEAKYPRKRYDLCRLICQQLHTAWHSETYVWLQTFCLLTVLFQWQKYRSVWTYVTFLASVHVFQCRMAMTACHPEPAVCAAHVLPDLNHHGLWAETRIRFFRRR